MKKLICLGIIFLFLSGCVVMDTVNKIASGGKIHITLGLETDAAYNNEDVK